MKGSSSHWEIGSMQLAISTNPPWTTTLASEMPSKQDHCMPKTYLSATLWIYKLCYLFHFRFSLKLAQILARLSDKLHTTPKKHSTT